MINGKVELSDIVYDFIKARYPSASKYVMGEGYIEIFINGQLTMSVYDNKVHPYYYAARGSVITNPTDPNFFDKLILMCGGVR